MNLPTSDRPTLTPDQVAAPASDIVVELLDACGNGYTAADLARALAAKVGATASTETA